MDGGHPRRGPRHDPEVDFKIRISETALDGFNEIFDYSWEQFPETTSQFG